MPIIRCPNCADQVEIEDDWYGRRIACPNCDEKFTPRRSRFGDDEGDDRPSRRPAYDDRPSRRRSRYDADARLPKNSNVALWVVLWVVVAPVMLLCIGCGGWLVWVGNATESFNGTWADTGVGSPPVVTASFPKPPTGKFLTVTASSGGEVVGYSNVNDGNSMLDVEFGVGYLEFPAGTRDPLGTHSAAVRQAVEQTFMDNPLITPQVAREGATTVGGYPAKETVYDDDTGNHVLRVVHVNDRPAHQPVRLVVIITGGPHIKDADKQKFLNSVRISGRR